MYLQQVFFITIFMCPILFAEEDSSKNIKRPCPDFDLKCVRKYFLATESCSKPVGTAPNPLIRPTINVTFPHINATGSANRPKYFGLDRGNIEKFFINEETGRAVLAVRFKNFSQDFNETYYDFWPPAGEPVSVKTTLHEFYPSYLLTTVFFDYKTLSLRNSTTHVYIDYVPTITQGPEVAAVKDPGFQKMVKEFQAGLATSIREAFFITAPYLAGTYIQYTLCDYRIQDYYTL